MAAQTTKRCAACSKEHGVLVRHPLNHFARSGESKSGYRSSCKMQCNKQILKCRENRGHVRDRRASVENLSPMMRLALCKPWVITSAGVSKHG